MLSCKDVLSVTFDNISATKSLGKKVHYSPSAHTNSMLSQEEYKEMFKVMNRAAESEPTQNAPSPLRNLCLRGGLCVERLCLIF